MALLRAWVRTRVELDRRDGRLAPSTLGRIAGAPDAPAHCRDVPDTARRAQFAVCGTRGGWVGTMAVAPRYGKPGHATGKYRTRQIHVGVGQSRRPTYRRHHRQPH